MNKRFADPPPRDAARARSPACYSLGMFASHEPRTGVVDLPSAGLPADHGLASLGLVMQLTGRTTGALAALAASIALLEARIHHVPWFCFAIALCFARSQLHRIAGRNLTYGRYTAEGKNAGKLADPFEALGTYAIFGVGHAIVIGLIAAAVFDAPRPVAAGISVALALWPCALAVIGRLPRFRPLRAGIPLGEDRGLEGASLVMTVVGTYGLLSTGVIVVMLGALSEHHRRHGWGAMFGVMFAILAVRSLLHVRAGLAGLRDSSFDRPSELAARYATFGVISAFVVGGMLALLAMSERLTPEAIVSVGVICWLLVTWPMIVKRFFHQRQFVELLAGDRVIHRRAPDAGLTGLGWLLAGHVALVAAVLILDACVGGYPGRAMASAALIARLVVGPWWSVGPLLGTLVLGLELACAVALIRMSDTRRVIATIYGLLAGGVTLVMAVPAAQAFSHHVHLHTGIRLLPFAAQLVLPVAALLLVHRAVAPIARAQYRRARPSPR